MTKENPSSSKEHDIQCICKFSSLVIRLIVINTISVSSVFTFFLHQLHVYIIKSTPVLFGKEEIKLTIFFTCTCSCQALSYTLQIEVVEQCIV